MRQPALRAEPGDTQMLRRLPVKLADQDLRQRRLSVQAPLVRVLPRAPRAVSDGILALPGQIVGAVRQGLLQR
jgi:hypothetical protein